MNWNREKNRWEFVCLRCNRRESVVEISEDDLLDMGWRKIACDSDISLYACPRCKDQEYA